VYAPPTTAAIKAQIIADIEGAIGQTIPILPVAFVRVLAGALAGVTSIQDRYIAWNYRQIFPGTADLESLIRMGERLPIVLRASVAAIHTITISGDDDTAVPAGTLWSVGSLVYQQVALVTIAGGVAAAEVECLTAGDNTTQANGTALTLPSPVPGITGAVVASTIVTGEDSETTEEFRARIIERMKRQPQGGAIGDYVAWALEVAGIVKAFVDLVGTDVVVYPLIAISGSARVPGSTKLDEVEAYLQGPKPLCATAVASAMTERTATLTISGLSPSDAATKASIVAAWEAYCYAAYPRQYADDAGPTDVISLAAVWAIIYSLGATATSITLAISGIGSGVTSYTLPKNEILAPGTITWA
jgi:uncharacterized phage protein gp47/JayE